MMLTPLRILLADDDTDDCLFFKEAIANTIHTLNTVNDGEQVMKYLNANDKELPHALFLDLNMQRKNGFECLSEIKLNNHLKNLSVVVFSTSLEQEVVNQLYHNGASYFIRKPSEFKQFKNIILHALHLLSEVNAVAVTKEKFVLKIQNI